MAEIPSVNEFATEAQSIKPRLIDTWILPGVVMYLAWASGKRMPNRWLRRIAFTGGVYMIYRNLGEYQKALAAAQKVVASPTTAVPTIIDSILAKVDLPPVSSPTPEVAS